MKKIRSFLVMIIVFVAVVGVMAQDDAPVALTSENVTTLTSTLLVDFADNPADLGSVDSGWFVMSNDGQYAAVIRQDGGLIIYDTLTGEIADTYVHTVDGLSTTVIEADFSENGEEIAVLHTDGEVFYIVLYNLIDDEYDVLPFEPLEADGDMPRRIWLDDETRHVWVEVAAGTVERYFYVARYPLPDAEDTEIVSVPSGPEMDMESFVRIGRIAAPVAITATFDSLVKRWNLETGEVTAEVQLDAPPVFGRISETSGTYLAWRDPESESLSLLDFDTGENTFIASLDGEYVQAILPSPGADVVMAVHIGDDPVVIAWDVETGEQYDLGEYRADCERVPDMVRLSADGTTLVIGCGVGLDVWRVSGE